MTLPRSSGVERAVILHVDDIGMCHGANQACIGLARQGYVTCGSVMVPCPWFREIAEAAAADPSLDLGVHQRMAGLPLGADLDGQPGLGPDRRRRLFLARCREPRPASGAAAAEAELRVQIERAQTAGIMPTHSAAHMAAAMLRELLENSVAKPR